MRGLERDHFGLEDVGGFENFRDMVGSCAAFEYLSNTESHVAKDVLLIR
jgi:hypothetical protein